MDLHVHDAVRYVGDMLAWMHQAIASEEEFLQAVFGEPSARRGSRKDREDEDGGGVGVAGHSANASPRASFIGGGGMNGGDSMNASPRASIIGAAGGLSEPPLVGLSIQELLARCLQGLGRPLRVRIMQVRGSHQRRYPH